MKSNLLAAFVGIALLAKFTTLSPGEPIQSDVYTWKTLPIEKRETSERRQILEGVAAVFSNMEIHASTIEPGKEAHPPHKHPEEEMLIVKEGKIKMTIAGKTEILGPGSVAISMPGDEHAAVNVGDKKATYYILKYTSKGPADSKRSQDAGGSFMVNWDNIKFNPHDKGGIRRFFERPTTMAKRIEMHVTTLNAGLKSHDPHTHKAEEIVLMVEGNGEMQLGDKLKKVAPGDLVYLGSNVLHAIRNDDTKPITYFAFQFD